MAHVEIAGMGHCLPGPPVDNQTMEKVFNIRADWIDQKIGTRTRHFAIDLTAKRIAVELVDICAAAAKDAITTAAIPHDAIGLLILSTATPDHLMPTTANLVADALHLNEIPTYQIQGGCAGALQALQLGYQLLQKELYQYAVVIGGDVCNKYIDFTRDFTKLRSSELINLALFGDGAGAAVLASKTCTNGLVIDHIFTRFEGRGRKPGQVMNWYGPASANQNGRGERAAFEDYKAIETSVPVMAEAALQEILQAVQWAREEVDYYMPPQLAGHITNAIVARLGVPPEQAINCVAEVGNNGNALPYIQLQKLKQRLQPGERAVGVAIESSKWIKAGLALHRASA